ncbi:hypothetical protein [Paenibacillus tepidiphilus]|uniref:hypothetical protein n=1 Tax=Paenibacillus tepidiphilus TaxID=2608683 RepID=UPI001238783D|nr:hypothetical protein [Paenibacillus tepidiphilus]
MKSMVYPIAGVLAVLLIAAVMATRGMSGLEDGSKGIRQETGSTSSLGNPVTHEGRTALAAAPAESPGIAAPEGSLLTAVPEKSPVIAEPEGSEVISAGNTHPKSREMASVEMIPLDWQPAGIPSVSSVDGLPAGAAVISEVQVEGFEHVGVIFYTLAGDDDYIYADLTTQQGHYELGDIGTYNYRRPEDLHANAADLFGGRLLKVVGGLGANNTLSSYYRIGADGRPAGVLRVDTGHTAERDLDGDGNAEAVAAHGLPMTAYAYRWHDGRAEEACINDALQADSVMLRNDLVYEASDIGSTEIREYRMKPDGLIPVRMPAK